MISKFTKLYSVLIYSLQRTNMQSVEPTKHEKVSLTQPDNLLAYKKNAVDSIVLTTAPMRICHSKIKT